MTVWPTNDPALVDEIINRTGAKSDESVKGPNGDTTLREALFRDCRITQTTLRFLKTDTVAKLVPHLYSISSSFREDTCRASVIFPVTEVRDQVSESDVSC